MSLKKRSVVIDGHKTSISLEDQFFGPLKAIAATRKTTIGAMLEQIDKDRKRGQNLSSAVRVFVLENATQERKAS